MEKSRIIKKTFVQLEKEEKRKRKRISEKESQKDLLEKVMLESVNLSKNRLCSGLRRPSIWVFFKNQKRKNS